MILGSGDSDINGYVRDRPQRNRGGGAVVEGEGGDGAAGEGAHKKGDGGCKLKAGEEKDRVKAEKTAAV
jgi:hypothetical protein